MGSGAKKWIVAAILAAAVALLLLFLFTKGGPKKTHLVSEGDQAPAFRLPALDGRQVNLSDFRGKVVMVHFWATWCPPCVEELPTLDRLYHGLLGKDFALLAVSVDEGGAEAVRAFLQKNHLSLPVLLDPQRSVAGQYGTFKFPETYLLDRNGVVRYKVIGPMDWSDPRGIGVILKMLEQK